MDKKKKIVILGSGFGGVYAYLELHKQIHKGKINAEVTMLSDKDHFLFVPLIHEVAVGNLIPGSVKQPVRILPKCCMDSFDLGVVTSIDLDKRRVTYDHVDFEDQTEQITLEYDYLVSALGSQVNFFGTPGAAEHAITLKTLDDAKRIKNTIVENYEQADTLKTDEEIRDALRVVIVGGGPTGVELAGELSDLMSQELKQAFPRYDGLVEVVVVQRSDRLVPQVDKWFSDRVEKILCKSGLVRVMFKTSVQKIQDDGVQTSNGFIHAHTVIWTAGVQAVQVPMQNDKEVPIDERSKRIKVSNHLHLEAYPNVFVVGDQAWVYDKEHEQPYPQRAQFAFRQGTMAGKNIARMIHDQKPLEFHWQDQGFILSLGKGGALASLYGIKLSGFIAWWFYRTAYVAKMIGWRTRIRTVIDWTLNLFLPRDISKY